MTTSRHPSIIPGITSAMNRPSTWLLSALLAIPSAAAQVVISEINFTPQDGNDDQWIELANLGSAPADLTGWAIYYATKTPDMPGTYWFAMPAGTVISSGGFLRVHWFVDRQPPTATDVYTGRHILNFLFGYGAEPLVQQRGALALLNSTRNQDQNSFGIYQDWVSWGDIGFRRQNLAEQANLWVPGTFAPAPVGAESLALDLTIQAEPTQSSSFFLDATPTPNAPNSEGVFVRKYGRNCGVGAVTAPTIDAVSRPVSGNPAFGVRITGTDGTVLRQNIAMLFGVTRTNGISLGDPIFTCPIWVGFDSLIFVISPAAGNGATSTLIPLSLADVPPIPERIFIQAWVLMSPLSPDDHGATGGIEIGIGS